MSLADTIGALRMEYPECEFRVSVDQHDSLYGIGIYGDFAEWDILSKETELSDITVCSRQFDDSHLKDLPEGVCELCLIDTGVTSKGLEHLKRMPSLTALSLIGATCENWQFLSALTPLTVLDVSDCGPVDAHTISIVANLPHLRRMTLETCVVRAGTFSGVLGGELQSIKMDNIDFEHGFSLGDLAGLQRLERVFVQCCSLSDEQCRNVELIEKLELCSVEDNPDIGDNALTFFTNCQLLHSLSLVGTSVSDCAFEYLDKMPNLREVFLEDTGVTRSGVSQFQKRRHDVTVYAFDDDEPS